MAVGAVFDDYPLSPLTPFWAALVGAGIAVISGRPRTRIDNFVIGGLFTGFAAYRDPRATVLQTLMVAGLEGLVWGVTDRIVPEIKEAVLPAGEGGEHQPVVA